MSDQPFATAALLHEALTMGLCPNGRAHFGHICALCGHPSSRHNGGPIFVCGCGCKIEQNDPGFWLSEGDFMKWTRRYPVPVKARNV